MLIDIVVDTNVFMHANNFQEPRQAGAQSFLLSLKNSETQLCVDEGFNLEEAKNRSSIGSEYLNHLRIGTLGYAVISHLAKSDRIKILSKTTPSPITKKISRRIGNPRDRIFVRVAFNSDDKILVSHDFEHMPQDARNELSKTISVHILSADEAELELE